MWWPNADQQQMLQQMQNQQQQQQQQNAETAISSSSQTAHNQLFSYKMASAFENTNTSNSNASNQYSSSGLDYNQQGHWWNYQQQQQAQDLQNSALQGLQNMSNQQQQTMQQNQVVGLCLILGYFPIKPLCKDSWALFCVSTTAQKFQEIEPRWTPAAVIQLVHLGPYRFLHLPP